MYLRNCWYLAGWRSDFADDEVHAVTILDQPLAIYIAAHGQAVALEDRCPHRAAPLSKGRREGDDIRCMYHGIKFGPDGQCTELPGQPVIPRSVCVRSYEVVERHGGIWVWMGDAQAADPALIPDFIGPDSEEFAITASHLEIAAEAQLLIDNLLDVSHAPYVHEATFGAGDRKTIQTQIEGEHQASVTRLPRGVHLERWHIGRQQNPYVPDMPSDDLVINQVNVPGVFTLRTRCYAPGIEQRGGTEGIPGEEAVLERSVGQVVTPVTNGRCKLFFAVGPWRRHKELAPRVFEVANEAFREDEAIIEAQQQIINALPDRPMMTLGMDGPLVRYMNIVKRLKAEEDAPQPAVA